MKDFAQVLVKYPMKNTAQQTTNKSAGSSTVILVTDWPMHNSKSFSV
jgi:hypothetical protein